MNPLVKIIIVGAATAAAAYALYRMSQTPDQPAPTGQYVENPINPMASPEEEGGFIAPPPLQPAPISYEPPSRVDSLRADIISFQQDNWDLGADGFCSEPKVGSFVGGGWQPRGYRERFVNENKTLEKEVIVWDAGGWTMKYTDLKTSTIIVGWRMTNNQVVMV